MASYNYGPPPPAPAPAAPSSNPATYPPYGQPYQQPPHRGGHRGRGGPPHSGDRGAYHGSPAPYGYGPQQPSYGQQPAAPYVAPQPPQGSYPQQQQWHPEQGQPHHPQPHAHSSLPPQAYHPNYPPHGYPQQPQPQQPQQPYGQQQPYAPAPQQQQYGQPYQHPVPQHGPPSQQWSGHQPPPQNQGQFGGPRGGRGGYSDRGGSKAQMMGPPIRLGFDNNNPQGPPAPVSSGYPPVAYSGPQGPPAPYPPAPYQTYPPPAPYVAGPPQYDAPPNPSSRHVRGGFHNNSFKSRAQFGGDKMRNRNRGGLAQTPPTTHQKPDAASGGKKKKRKTNTLGLTPGDDSEEDDENEEEKLNELIGADAPHPTDIAAWIEERRRNFPTKARIDAKVAAKAQNGDVKKDADGRNAQLERQQQKAEKLRKQLEKVESSIKRKREQQDEGDEMRDVDVGSPSSDESKSDDEKPETMSTRQQSHQPPPPRKADPTRHCKYYSTGGTCGKKGKCRFVHDPAVREAAFQEREMNGGRMTLQQRLTLNDKEQEDLTIVQTLKYLQDKGLIKADPAAASQWTPSDPTPSEAQSSATHPSLPHPRIKTEPNHGLPAIPPPSVVSHTPTIKYNGWNLSGFGNTGVKSNDV